jgi:hypothetical protein
LFCVEYNNFVIFCDHEYLWFFNELAKRNNSLFNFEGIWFNPFIFYHNLACHILLNLSQCQKINLSSESISKYKFVPTYKSRRGLNFSFTPRNWVNSHIIILSYMVNSSKIIHRKSEVIYFYDINDIDCADTH